MKKIEYGWAPKGQARKCSGLQGQQGEQLEMSFRRSDMVRDESLIGIQIMASVSFKLQVVTYKHSMERDSNFFEV